MYFLNIFLLFAAHIRGVLQAGRVPYTRSCLLVRVCGEWSHRSNSENQPGFRWSGEKASGG